MLADIVVDLQYGDCGKGKVAHHLCREKDYTHVIRYNGGCNAGHTIYHEGKKFITHHIPCGVFFGVKSIIGPGCVVHPETFLKEIEELEEAGIPAKSLVRIAINTHIITDIHRAQDGGDTEIGTTRRGNGPAYRDKYSRKGMRAIDIPELDEYLVEMYHELHENEEFEDIKILFEGAQGFGLDIDWGDYPYVTSSHCTVGSAILNGVPPNCIRDIWGVAKMYETYVGAKDFEGSDEIFDKIREIGDEYGSTTQRPRQVNWLDFDLLKMALNVNGVNKLVVNKVDVLEEVEKWRLFFGPDVLAFETGRGMKNWMIDHIHDHVNKNIDIYFSGDKERI